MSLTKGQRWMISFWIAFSYFCVFAFGQHNGKTLADRWYAAHPVSAMPICDGCKLLAIPQSCEMDAVEQDYSGFHIVQYSCPIDAPKLSIGVKP